MSDQPTAASEGSAPAKEAADARVSATPAGFAQHIAGFIRRIDSLAETFPLAVNAIDSAGKASARAGNKFLQDYGSPVEGRNFSLPPERLAAFRRLHERLLKVKIARATVPRTLVVALISEFDVFVGGILRLFYEVQPDALRASERSLTLGNILEFGSIEVAKDYVIEKEIESVLRKSHSDQFDALEKRLSLALRKGLDIWPDFIEVTERRNLFVHTGGIVTRQYMDVCRRAGVELSDDLQGSTLEASHDYFRHAHGVIFELGVKLGHVVWRKVRPSERETADRYLAGSVMYDLIFNERYETAIKLGDFALETYMTFASQYNRLMLVINKAQAHRWSGDDAGAQQILDDEDWSATSSEFQLAVAAIRDDVPGVIALMKRIGATDRPGKVGYREWPLFSSVRSTDEFQDSFEQVFGEPLSVVAVAETSAEERAGAQEMS